MKKKTLLIITLFILIVLLILFAFFTSRNINEEKTSNDDVQTNLDSNDSYEYSESNIYEGKEIILEFNDDNRTNMTNSNSQSVVIEVEESNSSDDNNYESTPYVDPNDLGKDPNETPLIAD